MNIHIPPAALEAGARAICAGNKWGEPCATPCSDCLPEARAAFEAMVEAWPNQHIIDDDVVYILHALILPLTENPDDKA